MCSDSSWWKVGKRMVRRKERGGEEGREGEGRVRAGEGEGRGRGG